jgi:hypothetical protein
MSTYFRRVDLKESYNQLSPQALATYRVQEFCELGDIVPPAQLGHLWDTRL